MEVYGEEVKPRSNDDYAVTRMDDNDVVTQAAAEKGGEDEFETTEDILALPLEPNFALAQDAFRYGRLLRNDDGTTAGAAGAYEVKLKAEIGKNQMAPFYEWACGQFGWVVDVAWLASMRAANDAEQTALDAKLDEATRNAGDMEILDALFDLARFFARIGDQTKAVAANDVIGARPKVSAGKKVDAVMNKIRISLFYLDVVAAKEQLAEAKKLAETGGDWDRNNRLAVYEAVYFMANRDVEEAAKLLLAGVATFTCNEICTYADFVSYAVLTNVLALERPALKKYIVDGPDILQVIRDMPHLRNLINALYHCDYAAVFNELLHVDTLVRNDRYLEHHARFLIRELRILVYTQFLDAYKSVTLTAMAAKFGVSLEFLDTELAHFVSCGRLTAKIDKVRMVVHTTRPDHNSAHYQTIIKQGDLLLNQIQKLARCVSV